MKKYFSVLFIIGFMTGSGLTYAFHNFKPIELIIGLLAFCALLILGVLMYATVIESIQEEKSYPKPSEWDKTYENE